MKAWIAVEGFVPGIRVFDLCAGMGVSDSGFGARLAGRAVSPVSLGRASGPRAMAQGLIVQAKLLDPQSGLAGAFRSGPWDRLKILVWDGTGIGLTGKLMKQGNFAWPRVRGGTDAVVSGAV